MRVLHVVSEMYPVVKTGGLADIAGALPPALAARGHDARVLIPGYPVVTAAIEQSEPVMADDALFWGGPARILLTRLKGVAVPTYVLESAGLFDRPGGPYNMPSGENWPDNHLRFAALGWAAAWLARARDGVEATGDWGASPWRPEVVHCHDWQSGLAPAYIAMEGDGRPATVMTIHNIAYQGFFPADRFGDLALPAEAFAVHGVEFWGGLSFLKGGCFYADKVTTVSPTYAGEIQGPDAGTGLDGLMRNRAAGSDLVGILNGVDHAVWNPATDPHLAATYDADSLHAKAANKVALQRRLGLAEDPAAPLFGMVGRIATLKGSDLVLGAVPRLVGNGCQLAVLGTGFEDLIHGFRSAEHANRGRVVAYIGHDEALAHLIYAGSDVLMVPSRGEPCGLAQLYSMRYGTPPLVRRVGGLADTVVNADPWHVADGVATGFVFNDATADALAGTIAWAAEMYRNDHATFVQLQRTGMARDTSWLKAAGEYEALYRSIA